MLDFLNLLFNPIALIGLLVVLALLFLTGVSSAMTVAGAATKEKSGCGSVIFWVGLLLLLACVFLLGKQ